MYLILWCIVFLIVVFGINLFLTLRQRQKRIESNKRKAAEAEDEIESVNKEHGESKGCSETTFRARTANNQQQQQNSVISDKSINVIGDDADSVSWIQNVIQWLYSSVHKSPTFTEDYIDVWLTVLNNKSKKLTVQNGVYLEFLRVVRERSTTARLVDVKVESETADNIVTTLKAICDRLVIQVRVASTNNATLRHNSSNNNNGNNQPQPPPQHQQSTTYEIILDKFSALLKVVCLKDKSLFVIRLLERPEAKVQIDNFGNSNEIDDKNPPITSLSPDLIINGILNVLTSTVVDLNFEFISNFPKYLDHLNGGLELPNHHIDNNHHHLPPINRPLERKLFVKIVNASNLYLNQSTKEKGHEIYCTVEVDEPAQCGKTSIVRANPESPEWDQHFMLKLNEKSNEVLFEVFDADRSNPAKVNNNDTGAAQKGRSDLNNNLKLGQDTFLGLGIVSVAELRLNPSQTLTIPLQTRPLEKAIITGDLVVELLLMEHNLQRQTSLSIDESVLPATPTSNSSATTFDHLNGNFNISPISIGNKHDLKFNNLEDFANYTDSISQPDLNGKTALSYKLQFDENVSNIVTPEEQFKNTTLPFNASLPSSPESRGSRSKEHHSLIRTIRKRLSFSGKRSKSVERRPTSREGSITEEERTRSVPGSREPSMPKEILNGKKHQESFSNLSEASTRTFLHDASELIIETTENGNKKHFVVTNPKQNRAKWRRKGIKLHLFNDHLFVARHISGSSSCQVCQKSFARRLGKQGYQCRDCGFMCHKQCHVKVENHCLNSSIASLHLVPIDTDSTDLKKVASSKTASIERNQASTSASQLPATIPELMVTPSPEETSSIENHNNKYGYN